MLGTCQICRKVLFLWVFSTHKVISIAKCGVLRVNEGGPVAIKEKLHNGLYFLYSSTIVGVTLFSCCLVPDSNITYLWYMSLGHMSDIWMLVLLDHWKIGKISFC